MLAIATLALACTPKPASGPLTLDGRDTQAADHVKQRVTKRASTCSKLARARTSKIPAAPMINPASEREGAFMTWTGEGVLVWSNRGDRAAYYAPSTQRWRSLDDALDGLRIHGVAGRHFVTVREGEYPKPLAGVVVDAHTGKTRPFAAPTRLLLEPLVVGDSLLYSADSRAPASSDELVLFDPARDSWTRVTAPSVASLAQRQNSADVIGDSFYLRWAGSQGGAPQADGSVLDLRTATRVAISKSNAPAARVYPLGDAHGRRVAVWGGVAVVDGRQVNLDDGGIYDIDAKTWRPVPALADEWTTLRGVSLGERALVAWGERGQSFVLATFALERETWSLVELPSRPGRVVHETGDGSLVFVDGSAYAWFDVAEQRWCEGSPPDTDRPRFDLRSAWTGEALVLWGGASQGGSGGCENFEGPGGCDPWVEHIPHGDGWLIEMR